MFKKFLQERCHYLLHLIWCNKCKCFHLTASLLTYFFFSLFFIKIKWHLHSASKRLCVPRRNRGGGRGGGERGRAATTGCCGLRPHSLGHLRGGRCPSPSGTPAAAPTVNTWGNFLRRRRPVLAPVAQGSARSPRRPRGPLCPGRVTAPPAAGRPLAARAPRHASSPLPAGAPPAAAIFVDVSARRDGRAGGARRRHGGAAAVPAGLVASR